MPELIARIDPDALTEIRRIRELLEERKGTITQSELVAMLKDALERNVDGIRSLIECSCACSSRRSQEPQT